MIRKSILIILTLLFLGCSSQNKINVNTSSKSNKIKEEEIVQVAEELQNYKDIGLTKIKVNNEKILFINTNKYLFFDTNKHNIKNTSKIKDIFNVLLERKNIKLFLVGHTDSKGNDYYNQLLSELRAKEVYTYFIKNGFNKENVDYIGYGEEQPISSNKTETGRKLNRRVEIIVSTTTDNAKYFIESRNINIKYLNDHSNINKGTVKKTIKGQTKNKSTKQIEEMKKKVSLPTRNPLIINIQKRKHIINDK